ncbi:MAG: glycosyltransferase family 2 protein [Candidatus Korobacteraceae bacterium]
MSLPINVVVVTYNSAADIVPCLRSIGQNGAVPVVVDNGSTDDTLALVRRECPSCVIVSSPANGYARAINLGAQRCSGDFMAFSNADVVFPPGSLLALTRFVERNPSVGVAGPQQVFPDGAWQRSWGVTPGIPEALLELFGITTIWGELRRALWPRRLNRAPRDVGYLDGAVLVVSRSAFDAVSGFDDSFEFYAEESDFCMRVRHAGWRIVAVPRVTIVHHRGGSSTQSTMSAERHVELLVRANRKLILKHYDETYYARYVALKWLFYSGWGKLLRLMRWVFPSRRREQLTNKIALHECYARQLAAERKACRNQPLRDSVVATTRTRHHTKQQS